MGKFKFAGNIVCITLLTFNFDIKLLILTILKTVSIVGAQFGMTYNMLTARG